MAKYSLSRQSITNHAHKDCGVIYSVFLADCATAAFCNWWSVFHRLTYAIIARASKSFLILETEEIMACSLWVKLFSVCIIIHPADKKKGEVKGKTKTSRMSYSTETWAKTSCDVKGETVLWQTCHRAETFHVFFCSFCLQFWPHPKVFAVHDLWIHLQKHRHTLDILLLHTAPQPCPIRPQVLLVNCSLSWWELQLQCVRELYTEGEGSQGLFNSNTTVCSSR